LGMRVEERNRIMNITQVTASALLAVGSQASAATNLDILSDVGGTEYQENNGGEFIAQAAASLGLLAGGAGSLSGSTFQTFCIELNETLNIPGSYVATINTAAVNGGVGGGNPDPLSAQTAWLYSQFRNGSLNYAYSGTINETTSAGVESFNREDTARALQLAIWFLENEITDFSSVAGSLAERRLAQVYVDAANNSGATGIGRVVVLNLRNMDGTDRQDVLALVIPLPQTAAMAGLGLLGLAARRRRAL
jgi:hypothetical protein